MKTGGNATIKIVGYHPANPESRNLPTILSTISVYDTNSGHLIGLADGTFLTALRIGAASAIASRLMAAPQMETVGLIGCGAQALAQLHALSRVLEIKEVLVYDKDASVSQSFAKRASFMDAECFEIEVCELQRLVKSSDVICTSTTVGIGEGPVFENIETKPWTHINAVGSDFPVNLSFRHRS